MLWLQPSIYDLADVELSFYLLKLVLLCFLNEVELLRVSIGQFLKDRGARRTNGAPEPKMATLHFNFRLCSLGVSLFLNATRWGATDARTRGRRGSHLRIRSSV